ncbi:MAG: hypothetical protein PHV23_04465 [Candidatus Gracilibacteria bacterium]|nr:hypothetical protein [Candidatus Gracilibacteria bacterium]
MDEATLNMLSNSGITDLSSMGGIDPNMMFSPGVAGMIGTAGTVINIISIIMYFGTAYGLYLINSKLGEKYAWLSFVPIAQYYNYFSASQKSVKNYLVYPILAIILGVILSIFTFGLTAIIAIIYFLVMWIKLLHAISLRTGNGAWTTVGFLFISFIMFPIVGTKMKDNSEKEIFVTENEIPVLTNKSENEIEL